MSKRILIVFGTRPEVIKLAPLIIELKNSTLKKEIAIVSTAQHEDLLDEQLKHWNIIPDYFLTPCAEKGNLTRLLSHTLSGLQDILEDISTIEYMLVQGDTNTALACANSAFLNRIKLVHIEAGLRSFDFNNPFPEEYNRIVASKVSYFHFAPTEKARKNLLAEGIDSSAIMVVGNTVIDALNLNKPKFENKKKRNTVLITLHRRENIESHYQTLAALIQILSVEHPNLNFTWVTHPNGEKNIKSRSFTSSNVKICRQLPYSQFIELYDETKMVITDSGGVSEEAIHLGIPIIVFRKKTERIEAFEKNYPMLVSIEKNAIHDFFNEHIHKPNSQGYSYGEGNSSSKIVNWLTSELYMQSYDVTIIGGGPAGSGLLLKSIKDGKQNKLFDKKVAVIEKKTSLIKGNITQFKVNSDTFSDVFLECLDGSASDVINVSDLKDEIDLIRQYKGFSIPLDRLENYYNKLGSLLKDTLTSNKNCDFFLNSGVEKIIINANGLYEVFFDDKKASIYTKQVVLATGGKPFELNATNLQFAQSVSLLKHKKKCLHTDTILRSNISDSLKKGLTKRPKIVILGGSHSAFSVAHYFINSEIAGLFEASAISIWCNALPKIYFNNREEALAQGYSAFSDEDICPVTKKVYRLAGLRMDGRDLYMRMLGLNNFPKENRVNVKIYDNQNLELERELEDAGFVILAYGYQFNMVPIYDAAGKKLRFAGEKSRHWVNGNCEVLDEYGNAIRNIYASGLATGFIPSGDLGGEPSFGGQTNGIWYYQNAIAQRIIDNLY